MSFKEVKELRKSGKLEEALKMALSDYDTVLSQYKNPDNESFTIGELHPNEQTSDTNKPELKLKVPIDILWAKRAIAWVYHDYLKQNASVDNFDTFIEYAEKLKSLELPEEEKMIFDTCAYQVGKLLFALTHVENIDYKRVNILFEIVQKFHFTKPSEAYSFLYKAFHKGYKNWSNYLSFADWWGFRNFRSQDFLHEEFNGRKIMSIVEQAYIAYSKKLLEGEPVESNGFVVGRAVNKEKVQEFLPKLDEIIEAHPEYQYPPYFKAKLLLTLGDKDDVLEAFVPFAKKKRNDFWVWELLADVFPKDDKKSFACLCKALTLRTPESFLINTRQKLAELLINQKKYQEAKTEIEKIISARNENNWRMPKIITDWTEQEWYKTTEAFSNNNNLYQQFTRIAEEILFYNIPEEVVVIEFINTSKSIINFVKDKNKHGFFNYKGLIENPEIGNLIKVRFNGEGQDGFFKALTVKRANERESPALRDFEGDIKIIEPANFGFVEDIFIEPNLVSEHQLKQHQRVKGRAILSFNKKKSEWGWKAVSIS